MTLKRTLSMCKIDYLVSGWQYAFAENIQDGTNQKEN